MTANQNPPEVDITFDREVFIKTLLGELADVLENITGKDDAAGIVSIVGKRLGEMLNQQYRTGHNTIQLNLEQVCHALVDLKNRIDGDFSIQSVSPEKIVFVNNRCPFGAAVVGRRSLCMMTSNVFGTITSENLGYAKVELKNTIAAGDGICQVVVHLQPTYESAAAEGREYIKDNDLIFSG